MNQGTSLCSGNLAGAERSPAPTSDLRSLSYCAATAIACFSWRRSLVSSMSWA
jgi:hypothetical protein